jgi:hypothetical protein
MEIDQFLPNYRAERKTSTWVNPKRLGSVGGGCMTKKSGSGEQVRREDEMTMGMPDWPGNDTPSGWADTRLRPASPVKLFSPWSFLTEYPVSGPTFCS